MADLNSSVCISTLCASVLDAMGLYTPDTLAPKNPVIDALKKRKIGENRIDRALIYNPDAVALWIYQKYTEKFTDAAIRSDLALPMLSVMPSVTPVCFASMYSGVMPEIHGIKKYEKPVLTVPTLFDYLIKNGKKPAIVSTEGDSISKIFLEREMDYFIYDTVDEVNKKALELIESDEYDLITIYNGNYDSTMHKHAPEGEESLAELEKNVEFYKTLVEKINSSWQQHNVFYGFCPDHGCHKVIGNFGAHGNDCEEDMNVIHFYGIKEKSV